MINKPTEAQIEAGVEKITRLLRLVPQSQPIEARIAAREIYLAMLASTPQEPDHLRTVFGAALTLCHNATDECRPDQQVLVPGDDLQALNDALDVVEEADADREKATPQEPDETCCMEGPRRTPNCPCVGAQEPDDDAEWPSDAMFKRGAWVEKKGRASWRGSIVGWYRTELTGLGFNVESYFEPGSVQIYPQTALEPWEAPNPPYSGIVVVDEADFTRDVKPNPDREV